MASVCNEPNQKRMMTEPMLTTARGRFKLQPGETLLTALERTGHAVEYQCRSGYCGACRLQLVQPEQAAHLVYPSPPLAYVGPGQVLPCCCESRGPVALLVEVPQSAPELQPDVVCHTAGLMQTTDA
jgi:ferredoxin